jgi:UDP-glucose 4-epimerase
VVPDRARPRRAVTGATNRTLAVTGAGGYLGSRLIADVAGGPVELRALLRTPVRWVATEDQRVVELQDPKADIAQAFEGVDAVVHLAGHNEVIAAADPDRALAETVLAGRHVVEAARAAGVPRLVFVSTIHVYGDRLAPGAHIDEDVPPAPHGPYAVARLAVEHLVADAPDPVVLRLSNAVGAPVSREVDRWTLVAADLCRTAATTGALELRSTGQQWRDFIGLADVVRSIAASTDSARVPGGTYNLVAGRSTTVRALAELVQDRFEARTGTRPPLHAPEPTEPDPEAYHLAPDRLAAHGLTASQPLADSIDEIIELCLSRTER